MSNLYARTVFFVKDAESALNFYTKTLGFTQDWVHLEQGRPFVFQVSLLGFELILNQMEAPTDGRAGHGRLFIGVQDEQLDAFRQHLREHRIDASVTHWGNPTLLIQDQDANELFFWFPDGALAAIEAELATSQRAN